MADVTLTVNDADLARVARAVVAGYGRPALPVDADTAALVRALGELLAEHVRTMTMQVEAAAAPPMDQVAPVAPPNVEVAP